MKKRIGLVAFVMVFLILATGFNHTPALLDQADERALNLSEKTFSSLEVLTDSLTQGLESEALKTRAIFRWITHNIAYDCYAYHNPQWRTINAAQVFNNSTAVCSGYAALFNAMCKHAGIKSCSVSGFVKTNMSEPLPSKPNHAWNAVQINGKWHLLDITWCSGYVTNNANTYVKQFDDNFYLTPAVAFAKTHYPLDQEWQLLEKPVSRLTFEKTPMMRAGYYNSQVRNYYPTQAEVRLKTNESIFFKFDADIRNKNNVVCFFKNGKALNKYIKLSSTPNSAQGGFVFSTAGIYTCDVYLNGEQSISYTIIVTG